MNKIEELLKDLKIAYLNYENENLKETLKYLDRITETILKDDESLKEDIFWKRLTIDVFKTVVLNNFYNKNELDGNKLDNLLADETLMKTNIKEFCINYRNNDLIDFINRIENIADNPLKSVMKILMDNIGRLNIKNISTEYINNKIQKIDCFCGKSFDFDWDKIPTTDKFVYVRCPNCNSERKLKNMYFENNNNNQNGIVKITRDNYKDFGWNEKVKYQYRGLTISCDHEYDAGTYMMWIDLPKGLNYKFGGNNNGDLPYKHQFMAGYMSDEPNFSSTIIEIMDYVDKYYEYFESHIEKQ